MVLLDAPRSFEELRYQCELGSGSLHQHLQHLVPQALQRFQGCHAFCTTKRKCRPRQMSQHPVLGFQAHQRSLWLSCTTRPPLLTNAPWARCLKWLNTSDANLDVKWLKAVEGFMTMWKKKQIKCAYSQYIYICIIYILYINNTHTHTYIIWIGTYICELSDAGEGPACCSQEAAGWARKRSVPRPWGWEHVIVARIGPFFPNFHSKHGWFIDGLPFKWWFSIANC